MFVAAMAAAVAEVSCGGGNGALPKPPTTPAEASIVTPTRQVVDMSVLPDQLPPAVARVAKAAVSVEYKYDEEKEGSTPDVRSYTRHAEDGSGFRIAPDVYVTAGHVAHDSNNQPLPYVNACGNLRVFTSTNEATGITEVDGKQYEIRGSDIPAGRYVAEYTQRGPKISEDIGVIEAPAGNSPVVQSIAEVAPHQPMVGDPVYFINFQPTNDGRSRSASQQEVFSKDDLDSAIQPAMSEPAIYGGIVVSVGNGKNMVILTGGESYVPLGDSNLRHGASGGMVVNQQGQVVAESVASVNYDGIDDKDTYTEANLERLAAITIKGATSSAEMGIALARPVTTEHVQEMLARLSVAPSCVVDKAHSMED